LHHIPRHSWKSGSLAGSVVTETICRGFVRQATRGQPETGRTLDDLENPNPRLCRLFLSMMDKLGVDVGEFGDAQRG